MRDDQPQACADCVDVHGDTAAEWLSQWPLGAEWRKRFGVYLCDGCAEERADAGCDSYPWEMGDTF